MHRLHLLHFDERGKPELVARRMGLSFMDGFIVIIECKHFSKRVEGIADRDRIVWDGKFRICKSFKIERNFILESGQVYLRI